MNRREFLASASLAAMTAATGSKLINRMEVMPYIDWGMSGAFASPANAVRSRSDILWSITRPWQRMTAWAEGTWRPGLKEAKSQDPYRTIYGYRFFDSFSDHPRRSYPIPGTGQSSDAAGCYQFLSSTYDGVVSNLANGDLYKDEEYFSPPNQDLCHLLLHNSTGAHNHLSDGSVTNGGVTRVRYSNFLRGLTSDSSQWASLPGLNIGASTNQLTKSIHDLWSVFNWELAREQGLNPPSAVKLFDGNYGRSSRYGYRNRHPVTGRRSFHAGNDYLTPTGTSVLAPEDGIVTRLYTLGGGGKTLEFRPYSHPYRVLRIMHLSNFDFQKPGAHVLKGAVIALTGNTGSSTTGPHAHVELHDSVPLETYLVSSGSTLDNAGTFPVDPTWYLEGGSYYG